METEIRENYHWFIAYTYPKAEKKIHTRINELGVESFLPLQKVKRKWSDRTKIIEVPLFPSYMFVYTTEKSIPKLLGIREIVRFLSFESKLATIKKKEIEFIKQALKEGKELRVEKELFEKGQKVFLNEGPFLGLEGTLIQERSKNRFIIELKVLKQSLSIEVPSWCLSKKMAI